ncbi:hypothetical protein [Mesorhizobium sp. 131-2-1]|uniref:hypothetical protein n=1 Tax=Mesorhizobium sp. 131-2-1 TaxID=2744518 RepID=UPI001937C122|nr:hypothetical protein [Mesorhizobium sp. 131-2-1]BCG96874.1 hypothetical protein MesoLj131a_57380 [Mesorhizobium sp. 131-2-1]
MRDLGQAGLEGIVSKRKDGKYRSGRSTAWLKAKSYTIDEYDLLGVKRKACKPAFELMAAQDRGIKRPLVLLRYRALLRYDFEELGQQPIAAFDAWKREATAS